MFIDFNINIEYNQNEIYIIVHTQFHNKCNKKGLVKFWCISDSGCNFCFFVANKEDKERRCISYFRIDKPIKS